MVGRALEMPTSPRAPGASSKAPRSLPRHAGGMLGLLNVAEGGEDEEAAGSVASARQTRPSFIVRDERVRDR